MLFIAMTLLIETLYVLYARRQWQWRTFWLLTLLIVPLPSQANLISTIELPETLVSSNTECCTLTETFGKDVIELSQEYHYTPPVYREEGEGSGFSGGQSGRYVSCENGDCDASIVTGFALTRVEDLGSWDTSTSTHTIFRIETTQLPGCDLPPIETTVTPEPTPGQLVLLGIGGIVLGRGINAKRTKSEGVVVK